MGRPSKRTPETVAAIVAAIEAGAWDYVAAAAAGINDRTFRKWMEDPDFIPVIAQARARAIMEAESKVKAGDPLKWLTRGAGRRHPDPEAAWSDAEKLEVTGKDGSPLDSAHAKLAAAYDKMAARAAKASDDGAL